MWLNLLVYDHQCDNITKVEKINKERKKIDLESVKPVVLKKSGNFIE